MALFAYRAVDASGKVVKGELEALNALDLREQLRAGGLTLISARERRAHRSFGGRARLARRERLDLLYHLQMLLRAGVPVLESLEDLRSASDSLMVRQVAGAIYERIQTGETLAQAMAGLPQHFGPVIVSLVRAGEATGQLPEVLEQIVASLKWQLELIAQTKKALMYPAFVAVTVSGVVVFLMVYLVPQLVGFLTNMGQSIPLHTRALIAVSNAFVHYWWAILGVPFAVVVGTVLLARAFEPLRFWLHERLLHLPVMGPVLHKIWLARMMDTLGLMYRTGISIIEGLDYAAQVSPNLALRQAMERAHDRIVQGTPISVAFAAEPLFPSIVVRMLRVGESTGALDDALKHVSYYFNRDVQDAIGRMQVLIEPVLTVTLGLVLGWIMMAVLGPIYDSLGKIVK